MSEQAIYQPLETIRLLRRSPGKPNAPYDYELTPFALNSPSRPPFFVLSYVWGSPIYSKKISINGQLFPIIDSIHEILTLLPSLHKYPPEAWWWIDSICINQSDLPERSSQVQIMGKIFKSAEETMVWLGPTIDQLESLESRDCTDAIASLNILHQKRQEYTLKNGDVDRGKCKALRNKRFRIDWKAIERLLLRPWWRRVWTLQEFIVANQLSFYCGGENIGRWGFHAAMYALSCAQGDDAQLISKKAFASGWNRRRLNQWYDKRPEDMRLIPMIAFAGDCGATDDRDRIFAFMGLAIDSNIVGKPDYDMSLEVLYARIVQSFIKKHNSLDVICFAHLFNQYTHRETTSIALPSWVPDWRAKVITKVTPLMISQGSMSHIGNFRPLREIEWKSRYNATPNIPIRYSIANDLRTLSCDGLIIDYIDGIAGSRFNDLEWKSTRQKEAGLPLIQSTSPLNTPHNNSTDPGTRIQGGYSLLQTISRCLVLDRLDRYLNNAIEPHHFFNDFVYFCRASLDTPYLVHPLINRQMVSGSSTNLCHPYVSC